MEHTRRERSRDDEEAIIRRMKDECDQALAKQWKIANEQLNLVIRFIDGCSRDFDRLFRQCNKQRIDCVLHWNSRISKRKNDLVKNSLRKKK